MANKAGFIPQPVFRGVDSNGNALNGGLVYTYTTGTEDAKLTWQDAAKTSTHANPIVLDSRGEATIYGLGSYKLVLKDSAGSTIKTIDPVRIVEISDVWLDILDEPTVPDIKTELGLDIDHGVITFGDAGIYDYTLTHNSGVTNIVFSLYDTVGGFFVLADVKNLTTTTVDVTVKTTTTNQWKMTWFASGVT